MQSAIVFGAGPAGLIAAHAAVRMGASDVSIIARGDKSELHGAQYLHAPIPDVPGVGTTWVNYNLNGTAQDYRRKVYGDAWDGTVSPEDLPAAHAAWDIRATYDWLWQTYHHLITPLDLSPGRLARLLAQAPRDALVVSTLPRQLFCNVGHTFRSTLVYAAGDAPSRGIRIPYNCPPDSVVLNGGEQAWYRLSNIFGHHTVEWPNHWDAPPPIPTAALVKKPLDHNCTCGSRVNVFAGRYGSWRKGVLSHEAYQAVVNAMLTEGVFQ